jgi:hypothetical protein
MGTVVGGLIHHRCPRTVFHIAGVVTTIVALIFGPGASRDSKCENSELETQGA